jgi:hypothetical protein
MADDDIDAFMAKRKTATVAAPATPTGGSDIDDFMSKRQQAKPFKPSTVLPQDRQTFSNRPRLGFENVTGVRPSAPQDANTLPRNAWESVKNVGRNYVERPIVTLGEAIESAQNRDWKPLGNIARSTGRGVLKLVDSISAAQTANPETAAIQDPAIQRLAQERIEGSRSLQDIQGRNVGYERFTERNPSRAARFTRGVSGVVAGAAPVAITGALTGGSVPAMAGVAALQSMGEPSELPLNVALAALPASGFRRLQPPGGRARPTNPQVRATQPLPAAQGPARPTAQLPGLSRTTVEDAPTAAFLDERGIRKPPVEASVQQRLPVREPVNELPDLYAVEAEPFGVRANLELPRQYPGARGPRMAEAQFEALSRQAKAAQPPVKPPDVDASLGKLWERPPQQNQLFDAAAKTPWQDTVLGYYRANLLTNPAGRALDLGSTVVNQFADAAVRPIAAAVDVIVSKFNKQRSITGPSLQGTGKAFGSIRQGMRDARDVLRTGKQTIDSGADDALYGSEIRSGLGKGVDAPINGVFRVLGAMDAPFRRFGFERNLADRARVAAINESKRGRIPRDQISARAAQLVDDDRIIQAAVRDGERAVLSEPNRISSWLSKQTANSPNARLAIGVVQPFMRIPLNAILRSADFSGVGGIKALYKVARGVSRKAKGQSFFRDVEEQRVFAQNVASGSFGPAAFILGMELEDSGKLEGYYYTSKKDFPSGATPTSIEIGGERYDINRLGGFIAAPLFIGATYNRLRREGSDQADALLRSFSGLAQQAPALGYYGAPAKAGRILTADEPGDEIVKEAGGITSGFIPASGAVGAAAKAMDRGRQREAEGFTGPIMSRIPGLRERLPERVKPALLDEPAGFRQSGEKKMFLAPRRADRDSKAETPQEFTARRANVNQLLNTYGRRLIDSRAYQSANVEERAAMRKYLREAIGRENLNVELLDPGRILSVIRESAYRKAEKLRR